MSKSYNNFIPLFDTEKRLRKMIMKIQTNSLGPDEPKDPGYLHFVFNLPGICHTGTDRRPCPAVQRGVLLGAP